jgi:HPt (histidine-containing phosphotransfer) domain-containing protein
VNPFNANPFNAEELLRRLLGDRPLAGIVVKEFVTDAGFQFDKLRQALREADARRLRSQAHTLSGAAATVGAESLHEIAAALQQAGEAGRLDRCGELLPRALEEFERYKSALARAGWV